MRAAAALFLSYVVGCQKSVLSRACETCEPAQCPNVGRVVNGEYIANR
jgi:hypothetical protein